MSPHAGHIDLDVDDEGLAVLRMHDAAGKNAFSRAFVAELLDRLERCHAPEVKVVVITGLEEVWCAGGDRSVLLGLAEGTVQPYDLTLTRALLEVPVPVIAAMAGHAVGGGLVFGLSCDVVLMGRESNYGTNFMDMGFTPGMGTTRLIQVALGEHLAAEMMFGCQYFRGAHFEGRSHVNYVLPREKVERKAMKVARRMTDKPRFAIELLKRSLALPRRQLFEQARTMESMMHEICFAHPETRARIAENYTPTDAPTPGAGGDETPEK